MRNMFVILLLLLSISLPGQKTQSAIEFVGNKTLVLLAKKEAMKATGKLMAGETVKIGCEQGSCYFEIVYKERAIRQNIGADLSRLAIYEFDFGADGDNELVVVNDNKGTATLFVFLYSRGIIQKLFEKEIKYDRVIIKKDYIEKYLPGGLESVWNYYMGKFWEMKPFNIV